LSQEPEVGASSTSTHRFVLRQGKGQAKGKRGKFPITEETLNPDRNHNRTDPVIAAWVAALRRRPGSMR